MTRRRFFEICADWLAGAPGAHLSIYRNSICVGMRNQAGGHSALYRPNPHGTSAAFVESALIHAERRFQRWLNDFLGRPVVVIDGAARDTHESAGEATYWIKPLEWYTDIHANAFLPRMIASGVMHTHCEVCRTVDYVGDRYIWGVYSYFGINTGSQRCYCDASGSALSISSGMVLAEARYRELLLPGLVLVSGSKPPAMLPPLLPRLRELDLS